MDIWMTGWEVVITVNLTFSKSEDINIGSHQFFIQMA